MSLSVYNKKRNFKETAEPKGKASNQKKKELSFVIQRHKASRLHYDFRLEMEGVLKSWAVPKGPSLNPADKRLAMMVEDHPYDYKNFEGIIPEGNYGAGIVEIWDKGTYTTIEETEPGKEEKVLLKGLEAGNLKVLLKGKKLKGEFALVKLKNAEDNSWLLIKHRDKYAVDEDYNSEDYTLKSSKINKWLAEKKTAKPVKKKVQPVSRSTGRKLSDYIPAMLAKEKDEPFTDADWIFEIKWDGYRALSEVNKGKVKLYSRNGNSFIDTYPTLTAELEQLNINAVLDGEIVVLDEEGEPDFQKLQHFDSNRHSPLQYYVFDLLEMNGEKLYNLPLSDRKELLQKLLPDNPIIKYSDHVEEAGVAFFNAIKERNMEGIIAKRKSSNYYPGKRTGDWLKIKHHKSDEAIIAGYTAPRGGRKYFGALVLGIYDDEGKFKYIGHTGSGFDTKKLKEIFDQLQSLVIEKSPFDEKIKTNMPVTWVKPALVCELKFTEWTSDGKLRHPIFLRMRPDKDPSQVNTEYINKRKMADKKKSSAGNEEVTTPSPKKSAVKKTATKKTTTKKTTQEKANQDQPVKKASPKKTAQKKRTTTSGSNKKSAAKKSSSRGSSNADVVENVNKKTYFLSGHEVKTTNRTKIFFPDTGITKGDVIDYYDRMAEYILPYLEDRPESLFRTPNGINAKGFFHKDAGDDAPKYVESVSVFSESTKKNIEYILCNNKATLLYLANLGCIEINPWHSRKTSMDKPDYMIIDIDPSEKNTFDQVIEAALVVKEILDQAGAKSVCKTSGSSGLHVYVPMGKKYTYEQVKDFAYLVCMLANQQIPAFTTLERSLGKRKKDQIYMDYLQNRRGQTIASVYSLRPKPGATVSTPLEWSEVKKGLLPKDFTLFNMEERLKQKGDLFKPVLGKGADLLKCLERLE